MPARSWQGWQVPILTSNDAWFGPHRAYRRPRQFVEGFARRGEVAVSPASKALHNETGRIVTLGRGGSDTSAVAWPRRSGRPLRHLHRCRWCLHDRSPSRAEGAAVSTDRLRGNAGNGLAWGQGSASALGRSLRWCTGCRLMCGRPSMIQGQSGLGTLICNEEDIVETQVVTGIAFSRDEAQITFAASRTSRASRPLSSCRWPRRISTST